MLVLTRKVGEEIVIGDDIRITVVAVRGRKSADRRLRPKEVVVDRQEVHEKRKDSFSGKPALTPTPTSVIGTTPA